MLLILSLILNTHAAIVTNSKLDWSKDLANKANKTFGCVYFLEEVSKVKKYDYTDKSTNEILKDLYLFNKEITLRTYYKRFTKAIAYTYYGNSEIYLNTNRNPRDMAEMINTIAHESTHILGYGHGNNKPIGKENSVPYKIGSIAEQTYKKCNGVQ